MRVPVRAAASVRWSAGGATPAAARHGGGAAPPTDSLAAGCSTTCSPMRSARCRDAFEAAFLERQAFEEHFQVDVLLGDVTWETSYGLPGEGQPPRVVAHVTFDWPSWSQTAYRRWYVDEELESPPAIEMEIVLRVQRLAEQPSAAQMYATVARRQPADRRRAPRAGRADGRDRPSRPGRDPPRRRGGQRAGVRRRDHLRGPVRAGRGDAGRRDAARCSTSTSVRWAAGWRRRSCASATCTSPSSPPRTAKPTDVPPGRGAPGRRG